jgi:putative SOS response-associated peptidase YedK
MKIVYQDILATNHLQISKDDQWIREHLSTRINSSLFIPKNTTEPGDHAPIIRLEPSSGQHDLFDQPGRVMVQARWGLVPNEFTSPREADKYHLHTVRAERVLHQRAVSRIVTRTRCVVPVRTASLAGVNPLEDRGGVTLLAGLWTRYERPRQRVESFAILTRLDRRDETRSLVTVRPVELENWLNPDTPLAWLTTFVAPVRVFDAL